MSYEDRSDRGRSVGRSGSMADDSPHQKGKARPPEVDTGATAGDGWQTAEGGSPHAKLGASTSGLGASPRHQRNSCVNAMCSIISFLTDGPTEDRRLKRTRNDEQLIDSLKHGGPPPDEQEFPSEVLLLMAVQTQGGRFDAINDGDVDKVWKMLDADGDENLSIKEFLNGLGHPSLEEGPEGSYSTKCREFLRKKTNALILLLNRDFTVKVWDMFVGRTNEIPRIDFPDFIKVLKRKALTSLEASEHMRGRAFWGYGQDLTETPNAFWNEEKRLARVRELQRTGEADDLFFEYSESCCGRLVFYNGWAQDLWYYLCQNHAVFSIFLADEDHPLSTRERIVIEALLWGYTFLMTGAHNWIASGGLSDSLSVFGCDQEHLDVCEDMLKVYNNGAWPLLNGFGPFYMVVGFYCILFVALPSLVIYNILFQIHLCPCAFSGATASEIQDCEHPDESDDLPLPQELSTMKPKDLEKICIEKCGMRTSEARKNLEGGKEGEEKLRDCIERRRREREAWKASHVRSTKSGCCVNFIKKHMTCLGTIAGFFSLGTCVGVWFLGAYFWAAWISSRSFALIQLFAFRFTTYALQLLIIIALPFCPIPVPMEQDLSFYDPENFKEYDTEVAAWVGGIFWQWQRERHEFLLKSNEEEYDEIG